MQFQFLSNAFYLEAVAPEPLTTNHNYYCCYFQNFKFTEIQQPGQSEERVIRWGWSCFFSVCYPEMKYFWDLHLVPFVVSVMEKYQILQLMINIKEYECKGLKVVHEVKCGDINKVLQKLSEDEILQP